MRRSASRFCSTTCRSVVRGQAVEVRVTAAPQRAAAFALAGHREARPQEVRERQPARMLGEMHEQVVLACPQGPQQRPLAAQLGEHATLFPAAVDRVHLRDGGVAGQHGRGVPVHERIGLDAGRGASERGEHGRRQQDVAMMTKLGDERASDKMQRNAVRQRARHAGHNTKIRQASSPSVGAHCRRSARRRGHPGSEYNPRDCRKAPPPQRQFHARRCRQHCAQGADPRRGDAVHPALPRQDHHRQIRWQRDDRAHAEGGLRARRRDAEARRHESRDRARRRPADRRPAEQDGHPERVPPGHARDR